MSVFTVDADTLSAGTAKFVAELQSLSLTNPIRVEESTQIVPKQLCLAKLDERFDLEFRQVFIIRNHLIGWIGTNSLPTLSFCISGHVIPIHELTAPAAIQNDRFGVTLHKKGR